LMAGQVEASIESLRRITKLDPANIEAHKVLGDAPYLAGKEAEAERSLKAGLALDPTFETGLVCVGANLLSAKSFS
jgi:Flp pilus assembly protein TadD